MSVRVGRYKTAMNATHAKCARKSSGPSAQKGRKPTRATPTSSLFTLTLIDDGPPLLSPSH